MKKNGLLFVVVFAIMLALAATDNIRGAMIPSMKLFFGIQNTSIGWMMIFGSLGYMLGTYSGGLLCASLGQKRVVILGMVISMACLLVMAFAPVFPIFMVAMTIGNVGVAFMGIAINTLVPRISESRAALVMNLTHFCYGIGAMITQKIAGSLVSGPWPWQVVFGYAIVFTVFAMGLTIYVKFPAASAEQHEVMKKTLDGEEKKIVALYIVTLGFFVAGEMQTGLWLINYIKEVFLRPESYASTFSALFFLTFSIGRLGGGFYVERKGYLRSVFLAAVLAFTCFTAGWLFGKPGLYLISLSGFFFSIAFPTLVLSAGVHFKNRSAEITGIVVTGSTAINMLVNLLMGFLNDAIGPRSAFLLIPLTLLVSAVTLVVLIKKTERQAKLTQ